MNHLDRIASLTSKLEVEVAEIIAEARRDLLIPFCEQKGLRFRGGQGSWSLSDGRSGLYDYELGSIGREEFYEIPDDLADFLSKEHPVYNTDLGSEMEDYVATTYKVQQC